MGAGTGASHLTRQLQNFINCNHVQVPNGDAARSTDAATASGREQTAQQQTRAVNMPASTPASSWLAIVASLDDTDHLITDGQVRTLDKSFMPVT